MSTKKGICGSWTERRFVRLAIGEARGVLTRDQELIKVNALQVSPAELEAALIENPDIDDAAVVGIEL